MWFSGLRNLNQLTTISFLFWFKIAISVSILIPHHNFRLFPFFKNLSVDSGSTCLKPHRQNLNPLCLEMEKKFHFKLSHAMPLAMGVIDEAKYVSTLRAHNYQPKSFKNLLARSFETNRYLAYQGVLNFKLKSVAFESNARSRKRKIKPFPL